MNRTQQRFLGLRLRRALTTAVIAALAAGFAADASAQTRRERNAAREAYGRAQQLFSDGQFVEAEAAFTEAFGIIPNPVVLVGLAEAQERQGKITEAVATFERYLSERADAPDQAEIQARVEALRQTPGTLAIATEPPGASVTVDGQDSGEVTPAEFELTPGEHTIVLNAEGFQPSEHTVELAFAGRGEINAALEAEPEPEPEPVTVDEEPLELEEPESNEDEEEEAGAGTAVWVTSGLAAAGLVGGTILGFLALSEENDFDEMPSEASADRGERYALFADVAFGVAAVSAITAIVIFLTRDIDDDEEEEEEETATLRPTFSPVVGARQGGVSARMEF